MHKQQTIYTDNLEKDRHTSTIPNPEDVGRPTADLWCENTQRHTHWLCDTDIRSCLSFPRLEEPGQRAGTTSWTRRPDVGSRRHYARTPGIAAAAPGLLRQARWRWSEETPPPALGSWLISGSALVEQCPGRRLEQGARFWRASSSPDEKTCRTVSDTLRNETS